MRGKRNVTVNNRPKINTFINHNKAGGLKDYPFPYFWMPDGNKPVDICEVLVPNQN